MLFAFVIMDKPDCGTVRQRLRPDHMTYVGAVVERIAFSPLTKDGGKERCSVACW